MPPNGESKTRDTEKEKSAAAKWVREARGKLTQQEFAQKIGVHWVTVSNWERGRFAPDWESSERIRHLVPGAPPAPGVVPPAIAERLDSRPKTLEGAEVAALIDGMDRSMREYVRDAVYRIISVPHHGIDVEPKKPKG